MFWLFFTIDLCSNTSMEGSCRDLLKYVDGRMSILKNNQDTNPVSVSHPKQSGYSLSLVFRFSYKHTDE